MMLIFYLKKRFYSEAIDYIREHLEYVHLFNIESELGSIVNDGKWVYRAFVILKIE